MDFSCVSCIFWGSGHSDGPMSRLKSPTVCVCVCVCHWVWSGAAITPHLQWEGKGVRLRRKVKKLLSWFTSTRNFCCDARPVSILLILYLTVQTIKITSLSSFLKSHCRWNVESLTNGNCSQNKSSTYDRTTVRFPRGIFEVTGW
jgi:hypothetical protein